MTDLSEARERLAFDVHPVRAGNPRHKADIRAVLDALEAAERERDGALAQWGNFAETCAGMGVKPSTPMRLREHLEGLERERDEAVKLLRSAEGIIEEELEPMNPQPDGQGLTPAAQEIVDWLAAARAFLAAQEKAQ